tara:strand:+ start:21 stop:380 length:360 start_codon:yes stop_codon:yes gene_type:complete
MPPKNPYENIKITLKEDESKFLLNLLDESKFPRHELDIVNKIYGKLNNLTYKREMQIEQSLQNPKNKKALLTSPELIKLYKEAYNTPEGQEIIKKMKSTTSAVIKYTLSDIDATKEKND